MYTAIIVLFQCRSNDASRTGLILSCKTRRYCTELLSRLPRKPQKSSMWMQTVDWTHMKRTKQSLKCCTMLHLDSKNEKYFATSQGIATSIAASVVSWVSCLEPAQCVFHHPELLRCAYPANNSNKTNTILSYTIQLSIVKYRYNMIQLCILSFSIMFVVLVYSALVKLSGTC